jgi:hypothetical protein
MYQLCRAPYEVRDYIVACLTEKASTCSSAALELALCYSLGFGVDKDVIRSRALLERYKVDPNKMKDKIDQLKLSGYHQFQDGIFSELLTQGHVTAIQLVQCYRDRDRLSRAEWRYRKEIRDMEGELGPENDFVVLLKSALLMIIADQGRWNEAESLAGAMENEDTRRQNQGEPSSVTTSNIIDLALIFGHQRLWTRAEETQSRALDLIQEQYGPESPPTYTARAKLAFILLQQSKWKKAEVQLNPVVAFMKRTYGEEHPITTTTMANLATAFKGQGRQEDAEKLFTQITKANKKALGPKHPDTFMARKNFVSTYWDLAKWDQAEALSTLGKEAEDNANHDHVGMDKKKLTELEDRLGLEHPAAFVASIDLAMKYQIQGRWTEAEELQKRIIMISGKLFGAKHTTFTSKANLVPIYRALGRDKEAYNLSTKLVKEMKITLGEQHPSTLSTTNHLLAMMANSSKLEKAVILLEELQETCLQFLNQTHPTTLAVIANLGLAYQRQGK